MGAYFMDQLEMFPTGLSRPQLERLTEFADEASGKSLEDLQSDIDEHLERTRIAHERSRIVNLRLATAIRDTVHNALGQFDSLPANHRNWLAGACFYFAKCNDDEPDFDSPIGFEDDAEVLNACLRFAGLNNLCLNVEDYDDA